MTDKRIISQNICTSMKLVENEKNLSKQKSQKSIVPSALTLKIINDESLIDCLAVYGLSEEARAD